MTTIKGILYSSDESLTLDPMTLAYYSNVPENNRTTLDLHTRGEDLTSVTYKTYTKPTRARTGAIGAVTPWNASDTTGLSVTAQTALDLDIGKVLLVEDEKVVVKAIDTGANTIDVYARGAGGTTGAIHAVNTAILIHAVAVPEGENIGQGLFNEREAATNGTQIFTKQAEVTLTEANSKRKLPQDLLEEKTQDEMYDLVEDLNTTSINGTYDAGDDQAGIPRMTRGLISSILVAGNGNLVNVTSGAFTETRMNDTLQKIWEEKGKIDTIILSPKNKRIANGFGNFVGRTEDTRGNRLGKMVDAIDAEGIGLVFFTVDHSLSNADVIYCNSADLSQHYFTADELRVINTSDPTNPRKIKNSIMCQLGFNYTNLNRNFAMERNLTTS